MVENYIGIENELVTFNSLGNRGFSNGSFDSLKKQFKAVHGKSEKAIRTETGNGFYVDGNEIEILTPPIAINHGFASRLTDSLLIGRDKVLKATPRHKHTGYSMHWNFTNNCSGLGLDDFYNGLAVPFNLFGVTPLSVGTNLRHKPGRFELLGDHLNNEDQINATALLLGAYSIISEGRQRFPFMTLGRYTNSRELFLPDGRYSEVEFRKLNEVKCEKMQAQQFLETFYHWISPAVKVLGTKSEIDNLEAFISGDKKLEMDKFKYYAQLFKQGIKEAGVYFPVSSFGPEVPGTVLLRKNAEKRELPLEARLLGGIVEKKKDEIAEFSWERLTLKDPIRNKSQYGIEGIYRYASSLGEDKFVPSHGTIEGAKDILDFKPGPLREYNSELDNSFGKIGSKGPSLYRCLKNKFLNDIEGDGENLIGPIVLSLIAGVAASLISLGVGAYNQGNYIDSSANQAIVSYRNNNPPIQQPQISNSSANQATQVTTSQPSQDLTTQPNRRGVENAR